MNLSKLQLELSEIEDTYPGNTRVPAEKYIDQAAVGHQVADFLISKAKPGKDLKEAKKKLQDASKQLKDLRKQLRDSIQEVGYEAAPKHLWSVIQLIQQSQHMYTASGRNKNDQVAFELVPEFIRSVPSVWTIANTIDAIAEKKRQVNGQIVNEKV